MSSAGVVVTRKMETIPFNVRGETIFDLWKKYNPSIATFKNLRTGNYVRIKNDPNVQREKYNGKCYGFISDDQYKFNMKREDSKDFLEALDAD